MKRDFGASKILSRIGGKFTFLAGIVVIGAVVFFSLRGSSSSLEAKGPQRKEGAVPQPKQSWTYPSPAKTSAEDFFSPKTAAGQSALHAYYQKHPEVLLLKKHVSEMRGRLNGLQVELQEKLPPEEYAKMTHPSSAEEVALEDQMLIPALIMGLMSSPTPIGSSTIGSISTDLLNNTDYLEIVRPGFAEQVRKKFNDPKTADEIANSKGLFEFGKLIGPYVDALVAEPDDESEEVKNEGDEFRMEKRMLKAMEELEWNYTRSFTEDIRQ